jgi:hypothetical protein
MRLNEAPPNPSRGSGDASTNFNTINACQDHISLSNDIRLRD